MKHGLWQSFFAYAEGIPRHGREWEFGGCILQKIWPRTIFRTILSAFLMFGFLHLEVDGAVSVVTLSGGEYFVDIDPGLGKGMPLVASDGEFGFCVEKGEVVLDTSSWTVGAHRVGMRFQDDAGNWGNTLWQDVLVEESAGDPSELPSPYIVTGEYFLNEDPGLGNGIPLVASDGEFGFCFEKGEAFIDTSSWESGTYLVGIRFQNDVGEWGNTLWEQIVIIALDSYEVIFNLGEHGLHIGGGELIQQVDTGEAAVAPLVDANSGWIFEGWDTPFTNVTKFLTVNAVYTFAPLEGFALWADNYGLSGELDILFGQDRNSDGVQNGFEYAFGTNLPPDARLLNILYANGTVVIDVPRQDPSTLPYVEVRVCGSTNPPSMTADWDLPIIPAVNNTGKPVNRDWFEPEGTQPERGFFKLKVELR